MPIVSIEQQLDALSPEQLEELKQKFIAERNIEKATNAARGFGEGALLGLQGRPLSEGTVTGGKSETSKPSDDLGVFEEKERIKKRVTREFETEEEPSAKEKIETKLLEAVANKLGIKTEDVDVTEDGKVAVKTDMELPEGTSVNIGGVTIPLVPKKSASQEKRDVETTQLSDELDGLFRSFAEARTEGGEAFGESFGARGPKGRLTGKIAGIKGGLGLSPAIDVYNAKRDAFATIVAKAAGEVRPTDVDIQRFVKTLMSTERSDEENELIMQDLLRKVESDNKDELRALWESATGRKIETDKSTQQEDPLGIR